MFFALNRRAPYRFVIRQFLRFILPTLLALTFMIFLQPHVMAEEIEPAVVEQRSYKIVFEGNEAISATSLQKAAVDELAAFENQGHRRSDIDDAAFQMELAYRNAGYAFATVDYLMENVSGDLVITFTAKEGPLVILAKININGNYAFDMQTLLPFFEEEKSGFFNQGKLLFIRSKIESALSQIQDLYISHGYRDVVVGAPEYSFSKDRSQATTEVRIEEGVQYVVHGVLFEGDIIAETEDSLEKSRQELVGKPYFARRRLILRSRLIEIYGNLGYPDVMVKVREQQETESGRVVLTSKIVMGPRVTIAEVLIRGNKRTKKSFILNRLLLKPGERYDLQLQQKSFRQLYKTGLFSKVNLQLEKREDTNQWPLIVDVTEAPAKELYFEPGWGSYELLRLKVGFREKNLIGTGRILGIEATASLKAQSLVTTLSDPWLFNTDIKADLPLFYSRREEPSFTRQDIGGSLLLSKKLTSHLSTTGGYTFRMTDVSDVDPDVEGVDAPTDYDYASLKAQVTYDSRNDLFFPIKGFRNFLSAEHADAFLGSEITLTRLTGGVRYFLPLTQSTVLAMRYRTGLIIPGKDDFILPIAERFFNGGENTVRSFKQSEIGPQDESGDPVGGLAYNVINVELRQRLIGNLTGSVFFDFGNVSPNRTRDEEGKPPYDSKSDIMADTFKEYFKDFRPGVGFGLQYQLPVGPARIDLAFNPDRNKERDEDSMVFHFSVGMAF